MISQLKFVSIPVRDQDRALAFYRDKLGFKVKTDQPFDETQRWIELRIPGAETGVVLFTAPGEESRIGGMFPGSFVCDDVVRTCEELKARGVEFVAEPSPQPWGMMAIIKDSEGTSIVLGSK